MKKEINKDVETKEENKKTKDEELFIPKTKYKFLKILLAIILIGGLCTGAYLLYQDKFSNPKNIVKNALEKNLKTEKNLLIDEEGIYKINGFAKVNANLGKENEAVTNMIKDIAFQFSGEIDTKESIANIEYDTEYKDEKLINIKSFIENNTYYILLDGIYDNYLKIKNNDVNSESFKEAMNSIQINSNDINTILNALEKSFSEEIVKYDFMKENDNISIDGKTVSVLNNYVILKDNEVNTLARAIIDNLANNNEITKIVGTLSGEDGKLVLTALASEIAKTPFSGTYRINFYTDKGLFNKKLISIRQEITQDGIPVTINTDNIDDGIIISVGTLGMSFSIKIAKNSSNYNLNLSITMMEQYINVDVNLNYEKIKELTKPDISKSKNIEDLTDAEKKQIEEAFEKNEALKKFFNKIQDTVPELKA